MQTDLAKLGSLTFEEPDPDRFPALDLARRAGEVGGTLPAVLNAANEVAVEAFVNRRISFPDISATVRRTMDRHQTGGAPDPGADPRSRRLGAGRSGQGLMPAADELCVLQRRSLDVACRIGNK